MDMMTDNKNKEPYVNMVRRVLDAHGERWYQNGERHREDGPAVEILGGYKGWYKNGELHRDDGPAVERPDGYKGWYKNGIKYSEEEYELMRFFRMVVFDKNC